MHYLAATTIEKCSATNFGSAVRSTCATTRQGAPGRAELQRMEILWTPSPLVKLVYDRTNRKLFLRSGVAYADAFSKKCGLATEA